MTVSRSRSMVVLFAGNQMLVAMNIVRNLLLIPFYLRFIPVPEYGAWIVFSGAVSMASVADLGLNNLVVQRTAFLHGSNERERLGEVAATLLALVVGLSALSFLALWPVVPAASGWIDEWRPMAGRLLPPFRLGLIEVFVSVVSLGFGGILLGLQRPIVPMSALIFGQAVGIVVTLTGLFHGWGLLSIPVGTLAGGVFALGTNVFGVLRVKATVLRGVRFRPTRRAVRYLFRDSTSLLSVRVAGLAASRLLGAVVAAVVSTPAVVVFDVTRKAVVLVNDIATRIPLSLQPGLSHLHGAGERDRAGTVVAMLFRATVVVGAVGFGVVFAVNGPFVSLWTGPAQFGGAVLTACLCAAAMVQLMNGSAFQVLLSMGETGILPAAAWTEAVSMLLFAVVLGKAFGLSGIAVATMLSASASLALQGCTVVRRLSFGGGAGLFREPVRWLAVALPCPIVVGAGMASFWEPSTWRGLVGFAAVDLAVGTALVFLLDEGTRRIAIEMAGHHFRGGVR